MNYLDGIEPRETRGREKKAKGRYVDRTDPEWEKEVGVQSS